MSILFVLLKEEALRIFLLPIVLNDYAQHMSSSNRLGTYIAFPGDHFPLI